MPTVPANKGLKLPPEPLSADEVGRLMEACAGESGVSVRNRALIAVMYRAGLRISEAIALMPKDLDPRLGTLRVLHGKGDRARVVGMDQGGWLVLERWLACRSRLGLGQGQAVFCTLRGGPLKSAYLRSLLPRLARKAGIEKRVHAHGLRHTHAFELASEGVPLHMIQAQLGHSSLATTDRYLRHLNPTAVVKAIRAREWEM